MCARESFGVSCVVVVGDDGGVAGFGIKEILSRAKISFLSGAS